MLKNQACPGVPRGNDLITDQEHMQQQLLDQEAQELHRKNQWRKKVLDRLWEIAALPAEVTRGSITGQVKAISMIVAIEGLIPDRRAGSRVNQSAPPPSQPQFDQAEWLRQQRGKTIDPQPDLALVDEEDEAGIAEPEPAPGPTQHAPAPPIFEHGPNSSETAPSAPDTRIPFSIKKNPFARRN